MPEIEPGVIFEPMNTLAEIQAVAATLSPEEMKQLEDFLRQLQARTREEQLQEYYRITGVHPLPKRSDVVITQEMINQLRDEEDI